MPQGASSHVKDVFSEALRNHKAGSLVEAERLYRQVLAADSRHADSLHLLGVIARQVGRNDVAVELIGKAIEINKTVAIYHSNLGSSLKDLGRLDDAVAAYSAAIRIKPDYAEAHSNLSVALQELRRFNDAVAACRTAICIKPDLAEGHCNLGNALTELGRLDDAVIAYGAAIRIEPDRAETHCNLGVVLQELGRIDDAVAAYSAAIGIKPDYAVAHSNRLMCLHHVRGMSGNAILERARRFADQFEGKSESSFRFSSDPDCRLRIGYVSGDFARHPVGYFLSRVLANHDRTAVEVFCYSNRPLADDMTTQLQSTADHWRSLVGLSDQAAAALVAADGIHVLIDLSGHTAFNRLPMFAQKPAPVQATWLGFWGTTGLSVMDYILSDSVTIPPGEEGFYSEKVLRLPGSRFCYQPPDYAPPPVPPPCLRGGGATFGSFNNVTKVGPEVVRLWSAVLQAVPGSRLLLKWKSLADAHLRQRLTDDFAAAGIGPERLELRGASFHPEMLAEYGDVDVALDPFPFSGCLTSCEALWMGVPVITLPGAATPSRQTQGFLQVLGLSEWIAGSPADYVRAAAALVGDGERLADLRRSLRPRMAGSPLCDGLTFTRGLEAAYREVWRTWCNSHDRRGLPVEPSPRTFLHVGCDLTQKDSTTAEFAGRHWQELRLNIDRNVNPDIFGTMTDMAAVQTESVDAVFSSHSIEHLYPHELPVAIGEFLRVLRPDGFIVITCPDLQSVAKLIVEDRLIEAAYISPAGPVAPIDILYGHRASLAAGNLFLAHRCGFTRRVLGDILLTAGFKSVESLSRGAPFFDLWAVATKREKPETEMRALAAQHFPKENVSY
jgi:predicted O-linked N-acetylglucosamine transferase (SPINDLY family)